MDLYRLIIHYGTHVPDLHRIILLAASMTLFWTLENGQRWRISYPRWSHGWTNASFVGLGAGVQLILSYLLMRVLTWTVQHHWGLLYQLPLATHPVLYGLLAFLLLDLLEYGYHRLMHHYSSLWRFHAVHHADGSMDVSTVLREHPGETFIRLTFLLSGVFLSGVTFWALLLRQSVQIIANVAAHARYRLPEGLDRVLGWVFITPNIHHVHHHRYQPFTDSNYGDVLSIWDRLFGTFRRLNANEVCFGLDTHPESVAGVSFQHLLRQPFQSMPASEKQPTS